MSYNVSNYMTQGGATWTIGGTLAIASGATFTNAGTITNSGAMSVASGGSLTIDSGATLTNAGTLNLGSTIQWKSAAVAPVFYYQGRATTAEVNAGKTLLAATASRTYRVLHFSVTARGGAVGGATSVDLQDTASSPVTIAAIAAAALTEDETVNPGSANVAGGAGGGGVALTADKGVRIIKAGSDVTTATSFDVVLLYTY